MKNLKILFIDDDNLVLEVAKIYLGSISSKLVFATSGKQALELLSHDSDYDIILLDYMLPDMYGLEVLGEIRKKSGMGNTPAIIQTGMIITDNAKIAELKASLIYKPYSKQDLHAIMKKHLPLI